MKYIINEEICEKQGLSVEEVLSLLLIKTGVDIPELFNNLETKGIIKKDLFEGYLISSTWNDKLSLCLLNGDKEVPRDDRILNLVTKLNEIFPAQKKAGTCHYFRGNKKDTSLRLKKFFKLYGHYTDEQILEAARAYVNSFNGDYSYMRILKYFIWKDEVKTDSDGNNYVAETSDLANWIENAGQEDSLSKDWTTSLV